VALTGVVFGRTEKVVLGIPLGAAPGAAVAAGVTLIDAVRELWQLHGLDEDNPLSVSATQRTAGAITQDISGTTTVLVERQ